MRTCLVLSCLLSTSLGAQMAAAQAPASQPPGAQTPSAPTAPAAHPPVKRRPVAAAAVTVTITVTDEKGGTPIGGAKVTASIEGTEKEAQTTAGGIARFLSVKPGEYRVRFEHESYITLERDIVVKGVPVDLTVTLSPAPPPPVAPEPIPSKHSGSNDRTYPPLEVNVGDYLKSQAFQKEGARVDQVGCLSGGRVLLLQVNGATSLPLDPGADEEAYFVVVGRGALTVGGRSLELDAASGTEVTLPKGSSGTLKQSGRTTLVLHVVQLGLECDEPSAAPRRLR